MALEYRSLTLRGAMDGVLRTATFKGRQHTVVPVVALVEGVVHAVNSENPEFVPAAELKKTVMAWNGGPVMLDHPEKDGHKISANEPEVLEAGQLGQMFNAKVDGTRLLMEAWVDPSRADTVGEQARDIIATLETGGTVEVSVGTFITLEKTPGVHKGRRYAAIWREIVPDHLALLPAGATGACSVEDGCGAGVARAARKHLITAEGITIEGEPPMSVPAGEQPPAPKSLRERILSMLKAFRSQAGTEGDMSDNDLRRALDTKLRATEPAYLGIDNVYPGEKAVIYAVAPDEKVTLFRRIYALDDGGEISFDGERVEVEPVTRYEPVAAQAATAEEHGHGTCSCQKPPVTAGSAESAKEVQVHKNAERITALIANPRTQWSEHDRAHLESQSDERLTALEAAANPPAPEPPAKPELKLEDLPEPWRKAIEAQAAQQTAETTQTVEALAAAQTVFTKAELEKMPLETLKKMAALAGQPQLPVTFAGVRAATAAGKDVPPPPDFNAAIRASRAKQ